MYSIYENGIKQPYFSIIAKDTRTEDEPVFLQTIEDTLRNLVKNGMNERALLAGINYFEFKYREADYGSYPKGLMYGLEMMDTWIFNEGNPFEVLVKNHIFGFLRDNIDTGYFEKSFII